MFMRIMCSDWAILKVIPKPAIIRRQGNLALWGGGDWDPPAWLADHPIQGTGPVPLSSWVLLSGN